MGHDVHLTKAVGQLAGDEIPHHRPPSPHDRRRSILVMLLLLARAKRLAHEGDGVRICLRVASYQQAAMVAQGLGSIAQGLQRRAKGRGRGARAAGVARTASPPAVPEPQHRLRDPDKAQWSLLGHSGAHVTLSPTALGPWYIGRQRSARYTFGRRQAPVWWDQSPSLYLVFQNASRSGLRVPVRR
jgi:hypothetical protein